ncbi:MAG: class I SAM-dependent methyltransferase [Pseudomonadales bacterium]
MSRKESTGDQRADVWRRVIGPGVYPHQHAAALLNPLRRLILSPAALARRLTLRPDMRVLELGCGPGYFSVEFARRIPRGTLVLVDVQPEMIEKAVGRLRAAGQTNFETHQADARRLPLDDASIDVAVLVAVIGEVGDAEAQAACLADLRRVLKPGARLSLTEQPGDPDRVPRGQLHHRAVAAGFEPERTYNRLFSYTLNFRRPA